MSLGYKGKSRMTVHQGRRRGVKSYIVEPYKQVKLGLMFLIVNCVFSLMISGLFGYFVLDIYSAVATLFKLSGQDSQFTIDKFAVPIIACAALLLLFIITTLLVSIRYTHEIYGPLVSIHRFLDEALAGLVPKRLNLRESDQLQDLANKLNTLADNLGGKIENTPIPESAYGALRRALDDLVAGKSPGTIHWREADKWSEEIQELARRVNQLGESALAKK